MTKLHWASFIVVLLVPVLAFGDDYERGKEALDKDDLETAVARFTAHLKVNPQDALAYYMRGSAYLEKNDLDKAIDDFTQALRLDPKLAEAHFQRGVAYGHKKDHDKAAEDFSQALRLDPNHAPHITAGASPL